MSEEQYGFLGGRKLTCLPHDPHPHEANIIARAHSMMVKHGVVPPAPTYEEAVEFLKKNERRYAPEKKPSAMQKLLGRLRSLRVI